MPIPITTTTTTNATANVTTTSTAVHHAATTTAVQPLDVFLKSLGSIQPVALAAVLLVVVVIPLASIALMRSLGGRRVSKRIPVLYYDSGLHALKLAFVQEVAPNVYASSNGKLVVLAESESKPIDVSSLPFKPKLKNALYGVKLGGVVVQVDPVEEISLSILGQSVKSRVRTIADLLVQLYTEGIVSELVVNPAASLVLVADKKRAGQLIAQSYGRHAEEALVDIAAITGKNIEFEQRIRAMLELEQQKVASITGAVIKILLIVFVMVLAIVFAMNMFG